MIHSVHDMDGNRIAEYVLDDGAPPQLLREYIWAGGMVVAVFENEQLYFVRTDHIHRPIFATDSTGTKVWEATYLPFGGVHTTTGDPIALRFPGQWFQSESGLHQNWMRDYDPVTGRYLQADPLGLVDGASVYGYAHQSPGTYVDPTGEWAPLLWCLRSKVCIGAVSAGVGMLYDYLSNDCYTLSDFLYSALSNIPSNRPLRMAPQPKIPNVVNRPEVRSPHPVRPEDATKRWEDFLGPGPYTNRHPRTGQPDPDRLVSADGQRSIRYGDHEMNSRPTRHHYHEETWTHDPVSNTTTVDNTLVRVPLK